MEVMDFLFERFSPGGICFVWNRLKKKELSDIYEWLHKWELQIKVLFERHTASIRLRGHWMTAIIVNFLLLEGSLSSLILDIFLSLEILEVTLLKVLTK